MNLKKIAATGVMAALVVGTAATAAVASGTSSTTPSTTCLPNAADDRWPAFAQGAPARSAGVAVWHNDDGWHVRVTHNTLHDRVFSGVVETRGALVDVTPVGLERNDHLKVGPDKHTILFRFNNYGRLDGFDFRTSCAPSLNFLFLSDGRRVPAARISIGSNGVHPAHNPFGITRTA
ncbi:MAG TPA: hypothetical protein VEZ15_14715 [Acidimicrobiia bacterium]|nr:hypothetical protein [Acidimicrobiia bacterium]